MLFMIYVDKKLVALSDAELDACIVNSGANLCVLFLTVKFFMLNFLTFDGGLFNFAEKKRNMKTIIVKTENKSEERLLMGLFKEMGKKAKLIDTEKLENAFLVSLIEEGLKSPVVSREEAMGALE